MSRTIPVDARGFRGKVARAVIWGAFALGAVRSLLGADPPGGRASGALPSPADPTTLEVQR